MESRGAAGDGREVQLAAQLMWQLEDTACRSSLPAQLSSSQLFQLFGMSLGGKGGKIDREDGRNWKEWKEMENYWLNK